MDSNLKSYQSLYASLTAEITANLSKITQNLKNTTLPEDAIGKFCKRLCTNFIKFVFKTKFIKISICFIFTDTKTLLERVDKNFEDATELVSKFFL